MIESFGRTNQPAPKIWYRPSGELVRDSAVSLIAEAPISPHCVVDIHSDVILLGHAFSQTPARLMTIAGKEVWSTPDQRTAADEMSGTILATLSAVRGKKIDFWFLELDQAPEQYQLDGALQALTEAKEDGLVGSICLRIANNLYAGLSTWRFNDAFDVITTRGIAPPDHDALIDLAKERRVGVLLDAALNIGKDQDSIAILETIANLSDLHKLNAPG